MITYSEALEAMHLFLDRTGEKYWRDWIAEDLRQWEESKSVEHHLSAYGGMGSFNDMVGSPDNSRIITKAQESLEHFLFSDLRSICYYLAKHIHQPVSIEGLLKSMGGSEYPLQGWRCLNCGYAEVSPYDIDFYVAFYLMRQSIIEAVKESKLQDFVEEVIASGIPDIVIERSRVGDAVLRSGIKIVSRDSWMQPCPACQRMDTAVYRWREKGIFSKHFVPSNNNLPLKG